MTSPGNAAWLTASPMKARPRKHHECAHHRTHDPDEDRGHEATLHEAVGHRAEEEIEHLSRPGRGSGARRPGASSW